MTTTSADRPFGVPDTPLPDVSGLDKAEDRAAVDAIVATLVYHLRKEHPRPSRADPARRDAHPKHHGCVPATFEVCDLKGLEKSLAQGLFERPGKYQAWVRFSNAFKVRNDLDRDARGMAIKIMGVDGASEGTQDFLLVTHHSFFARTPADFVDFPAAVAGVGQSAALIARTAGFFFGWRPFRFRLPGFIALMRSINSCTNPLVRTYFSQTPYSYGESQVKFRARPRRRWFPLQWVWLWIRVFVHNVIIPILRAGAWLIRKRVKSFRFEPRWQENYLQTILLSSLRARPAVFDFQVQFRKGDMPLQDAVVAWKQRKSKFKTIATITIGPPTVSVETMMDFGQHLSYSPWHHLPTHTPLGSMNTARKSVYGAISSLRHNLNHVGPREPRPGESPTDYLRDIESRHSGPRE
jgi:hypothetical protein